MPRARLLVDRTPGQGPLGGLQTALEEGGDIFLLACDLPFLDSDLIQQICSPRDGAQAVVPRFDGRPQPLHARYSASVLPLVDARLARGARRMLDLLDDLQVIYIDSAARLININTPDDLAT